MYLHNKTDLNVSSSLKQNISTFFTECGTEKNVYPIPSLSVLEKMVLLVKEYVPDLSKTIVVAVQHNLETTATLFRAFKDLGVHQIYSTGKCYSDSPIIIEQMRKDGFDVSPGSLPPKAGSYQETAKKDIRDLWKRALKDIKNKAIDTIIILDDGGSCIAGMPLVARFQYKTAAIEQTRGGLYIPDLEYMPFPVIIPASSALKKFIEPPFIAKAILRKVKKIIEKYQLNKDTMFGVIGNDAIGSAIARYLLHLGFQVAVYDENESAFNNVEPNDRFYRFENIHSIIVNAHFIFSCTGLDISEKYNLLDLITHDTYFISCTSEDREFRSALKTISQKGNISFNPMQDIIYENAKGNHAIFVGGGYPFNFDREPWNVPASEIEPTQCALFGAFIQAVGVAKKPINDGKTINQCVHYMLDPAIQNFIVRQWRSNEVAKIHHKKLLDCFQDENWVIRNSGGIYQNNPFFTKCFLDNHAMEKYDIPIRSYPPLKAKL